MKLDADGRKEHNGRRWLMGDSKDFLALASAAIWVAAAKGEEGEEKSGMSGLDANLDYGMRNGYR